MLKFAKQTRHLPRAAALSMLLGLATPTSGSAQEEKATPTAESTVIDDASAAPPEAPAGLRVASAVPGEGTDEVLADALTAKSREGGPQGEPEPAGRELLPESAPVTPEQKAEEPLLKFGAGLILWYNQPFLTGRKGNVDTFFARITVDGRAGIWGLHLEPRFRDTKQRSFEDGPVFLQEAYVSASPGPVTIKVGKSYSRLGLFWDNSFYGNVQVYDGLKLAPDYGVSAEATHNLNSRFSLGWALQYFLVDGRTNVSLPARDIVSVPNARRRNAVVARVDPEIKFGRTGSLRVGFSGQVFKADLPNGNPTVVRGAIDAKLQVGGFGVWGEALQQHGRHVTDYPVAGTPATDTAPAALGHASSKNQYLLGGGEYTYGLVTARFNASYGRYVDTHTHERFFVPAIGVKPIAQLLLLAEYVHWQHFQNGQSSFVDRSLNITAHGFF